MSRVAWIIQWNRPIRSRSRINYSFSNERSWNLKSTEAKKRKSSDARPKSRKSFDCVQGFKFYFIFTLSHSFCIENDPECNVTAISVWIHSGSGFSEWIQTRSMYDSVELFPLSIKGSFIRTGNYKTHHRSFSLCAAKRINRTYTTNCQESSKPNLISIAFECVISFAGSGFTWGSVAWLYVAVIFYKEKINYRSRRYKDHEFHWLPFLFVSAWHAFENLSLCECWQITALTNSFHPHIHSKTYKQKIALLHCLHESLAYDQQL